MKNIILSASEALIEAASARAVAENTTLNAKFRLWLKDYARCELTAHSTTDIVEQIRSYTSTDGKKFTRDTPNGRR